MTSSRRKSSDTKNSNSDFSAIKVDLPGPERSAMLVHDSGIEFGRQDRALNLRSFDAGGVILVRGSLDNIFESGDF